LDFSHTEGVWEWVDGTSAVKSTLFSYLSKSKDTLIENDSNKSNPVKYYLSKSKKVFGFEYS
jgi:hypothetical protein